MRTKMSNEKMKKIYARLFDDMQNMRAEIEMKESVLAAINAGTDVYSVEHFSYGWRVTVNDSLIFDDDVFATRGEAEREAHKRVALDPERRLFEAHLRDA
jgi:hypothetical protein